ncbi:hypothetical protein F2P81_025723 [Scophthalmus maximus]|uniref:Uncharacterized protein n=1 Tax=Scophthalmus maximus TaxID=52904 RepID=A0A6A4RTY4_SCOMX|nr:hypothetical protein F2P81_025723 [Scophthalmus maximus]
MATAARPHHGWKPSHETPSFIGPTRQHGEQDAGTRDSTDDSGNDNSFKGGVKYDRWPKARSDIRASSKNDDRTTLVSCADHCEANFASSINAGPQGRDHCVSRCSPDRRESLEK